MHHLIIDGHNHLHRARSGFTAGDYAVVFNALRSLRSLVEQFKPTRVTFVLEGQPKKRLELFGDYKANRKVEPGSDKERSLVDFRRQKDLFVDLVSRRFPIAVVRHPDHEADDVIGNLIRVSSSAIKFTVVSTDTDFTQLLNDHENVQVYNPVKKSFVEWPKDHNYVIYKSLRGDASDNIPGIRGAGEKKAMKLASDAAVDECLEFLNKDKHPDRAVQYVRNYELVQFEKWTQPELMTSSEPERDWDEVKAQLTTWGFQSIVNDRSWAKFTSTFDGLFG